MKTFSEFNESKDMQNMQSWVRNQVFNTDKKSNEIESEFKKKFGSRHLKWYREYVEKLMDE